MSKLTAISSISVYKDVNLHWAGLFLACCVQYKQFGHIFVDCSMGGNSGNYGRHVVNLQDQICLANIYKKKQAPIMHSVLFGGKTWAQIASGSPFCVISLVLSGVGFPLSVISFSSGFVPFINFGLVDQLVVLKHSLELLIDQISVFVKKLSFVELVPLTTTSYIFLLVAPVFLAFNSDSDMVLNSVLVLSAPPFSVGFDAVIDFSFSSSKILTTKVGGLKSKIVAL